MYFMAIDLIITPLVIVVGFPPELNVCDPIDEIIKNQPKWELGLGDILIVAGGYSYCHMFLKGGCHKYDEIKSGLQSRFCERLCG